MTITHDLRATFTGREPEIYALLCQGLSNQEIAAQLQMPVPTVKWNLRNIYKKLGVDVCKQGDSQSARRNAILYGGTKIEKIVTYNDAGEDAYSLKEIRSAAKKVGLSLTQVSDLISFLEMER